MNKEILEAYTEWLKVCQGHPEAAALLTLVQVLVEAYNVNADDPSVSECPVPRTCNT